MSASPSPLEEKIVALLAVADGNELSMSDLEKRLAEFDTFAVRRAVWRLIDQGKADFTPRRDVRAIGA